MKLTLIITAGLIGAGLAGAQNSPSQQVTTERPTKVLVDGKLVDAPKPPSITPELREIYQQARADLAEAQLAVVQAQARLEAAVKAMQSVCPVVLDAQGKPQCVVPPKVEEPKPQAH